MINGQALQHHVALDHVNKASVSEFQDFRAAARDVVSLPSQEAGVPRCQVGTQCALGGRLAGIQNLFL